MCIRNNLSSIKPSSQENSYTDTPLLWIWIKNIKSNKIICSFDTNSKEQNTLHQGPFKGIIVDT